MESEIYIVSGLKLTFKLIHLDFSSYLKNGEDNLFLYIYDKDNGDTDPIGSASIDLRKHVFGRTGYEAWIKLPAIPDVRSKGEIHVILEHSVKHLFMT